MNFLLTPFGSSGDVLPVIGIGKELKTRGNLITLATNPFYEKFVRTAGLDFIPIGTQEQFIAILNSPDLANPMRSMEIIFRDGMRQLIRPLFDLAREFAGGREGVILASSFAIGARLAQEKFGDPVINIESQILSFGNSNTTTVDRDAYLLIDQMLEPDFGQLRRELALPPVHNIVGSWAHSPLLNVGLWPDWFAPPQNDWPPNVCLTGFPLYDGAELDAIPDALDVFLKEGPPPVVFISGSGMRHVKQFFQESLNACLRANTRGLFFTTSPGEAPVNLPPTLGAFEYVPFSRVLPRASALVHVGGIGPMSLAFAAGIPQIVVPLSFDHPDNAAHLERLGAGLLLSPNDYREERIAERLNELLGNPTYRQHAQTIRERLELSNGIKSTCDLIEQTADSALNK